MKDVIVISEEAADRMLKVLDNPTPPSEALLEAARKHRELKNRKNL